MSAEVASAAADSPPSKMRRLESEFPSQVVIPSTILCDGEDASPQNASDTSPAGPSSARSSNGTHNEDDNNIFSPTSIMEFLSKGLLSSVFKADPLGPPLLHPMTPTAPPTPTPSVPGSIAVAAMPTAQLFAEDDWSWHRNPAASIRSGGTNKQTPVWKYFVYDKAENLSRCIIGDCTYQLKGPHTSTLACHLKKHTAEYAEFTRLKMDYQATRTVNGGPPPIQNGSSSAMPSSPSSSSSSSATPVPGHAPFSHVSSAASLLTSSSSSSMSNLLANHNNNNVSMPGTTTGSVVPKEDRMQGMSSLAAALASRVSPSTPPLPRKLKTPPIAPPAAIPTSSAMIPSSSPSTPAPSMLPSMTPHPLLAGLPGGLPFFHPAFSAMNPTMTNFLLQQHGMALGPNGQIVQTKKWRRDEKKQREMEHRVSMFISSTRLPSSVVVDPAFRDLLESAQPKFTCPEDALHVEQTITATCSRLQMAIRQLLHSPRRVCLLLDLIPVPCPTRPYRLAITAALHTPAHAFEHLLLGVRALESGVTVDGLKGAVAQVLAEYGLSLERINRIVTAGIEAVEGEGMKTFGGKQMSSYKPLVLAALQGVVETSEHVASLRTSVFAMVLSLMTHEGAPHALTKAVGHPVQIPLPVADNFFAVLEVVLSIKSELLAVLTGAGVAEIVTDEQWKACECIVSLLNRLRPKGNGSSFPSLGSIKDASETMDTVVPSLMQMVINLEKDAESLGALGAELKEAVTAVCAPFLDVDNERFDGAFVQATAMNPQLVCLLKDDQITYAKGAIEKSLNDRMRREEEAASRKRTGMSLDNLLASVIDRRSCNGTDPSDSPPANGLLSLYPDLHQAAQQKKKSTSDPSTRPTNRFAEAIVQTYFDDVTQTDCSASVSFSNRHLPPLFFWENNNGRSPPLADIALELLTVPAATPGPEALFGCHKTPFDPLALVTLPERLERDALLRFNRAHIPKSA